MTAAIVFLLGMYLSMRAIAALYRVLDLWYTIRTLWPMVLRGLIVWAGGLMLVAWVLPQGPRDALLWGAGTFAAFYAVAGAAICYVLVPVIVAKLKASGDASGRTS